LKVEVPDVATLLGSRRISDLEIPCWILDIRLPSPAAETATSPVKTGEVTCSGGACGRRSLSFGKPNKKGGNDQSIVAAFRRSSCLTRIKQLCFLQLVELEHLRHRCQLVELERLRLLLEQKSQEPLFRPG
jgi:hypothetical protein